MRETMFPCSPTEPLPKAGRRVSRLASQVLAPIATDSKCGREVAGVPLPGAISEDRPAL